MYHFSLGVPPEVVGDFNYSNPVIDSEKIPDQHTDFVNETGTSSKKNYYNRRLIWINACILRYTIIRISSVYNSLYFQLYILPHVEIQEE